MKKLLLLFLLFSTVCIGQNVTITLSKADIVDINKAIKQDMVQDSVISSDKTTAAKSCEDALKRANKNQTVTVPQKYILSTLQGLAWQYQTVESQMKFRRKFLRIVKEMAINDPNLSFLTNQQGFFYFQPDQINIIKEQIKGVLE